MQRFMHVLRSLALASITTNKDFNEAALGAALCSHQFQKIVIRLFVIDEFIILLAYHNRNFIPCFFT